MWWTKKRRSSRSDGEEIRGRMVKAKAEEENKEEKRLERTAMGKKGRGRRAIMKDGKKDRRKNGCEKKQRRKM